MYRIAIFASGTGTNASKIIDYFDEDQEVEVALILSNKPNAYVLEVAKNHHIPSQIIEKESFYNTDSIVQDLITKEIDLIVLAGFLWLIPKNLVVQFEGRIINIHPALLPKYGGKGMYGMNVHKAVSDAKEKETGISIHYVNNNYDEGKMIFQAHCTIEEEDGPEEIAKKVQKLEHKYFPFIVDKVLRLTKNNK